MKKLEAAFIGMLFLIGSLAALALFNPALFRDMLIAAGVLGCIGLVIIIWRLIAEHRARLYPHVNERRQIEAAREAARELHEREMARIAADGKRQALEWARVQNEARQLDIAAMKHTDTHSLQVRQFEVESHVTLSRVVTPEGSATHLLGQGGEIITLASPERQRQIAAPGAPGKQQAEPPALVVPTAPHFRDMCHMIKPDRLILCYVWDEARQASVPLTGTVDDLLSMIITGKPGRGKTTALMYYIAILMSAGAEVVTFDPHGTMGELAAIPGVVYLDRKDDILRYVPMLQQELAARDELYRPAHQTKHPLLLLADELPLLAEYDEDLAKECKRDKESGHETYQAYSPNRIIRRFVLEARKWRCYFIGSGQSIDADVLPRKTTDSIASRIVFFSSDMRARMSGLESEAVKRLMPLIRRAESGSMIFDLARADEPVLGALPNIDVESMLSFLEGLGDHRGTIGARDTGPMGQALDVPANVSQIEGKRQEKLILRADYGTQGLPPMEPLRARVPESPVASPASPTGGFTAQEGDMTFDLSQEAEFLKRYKGTQSIKEALRQMGLSNRYHRYASYLVSSRKLRRA